MLCPNLSLIPDKHAFSEIFNGEFCPNFLVIHIDLDLELFLNLMPF